MQQQHCWHHFKCTTDQLLMKDVGYQALGHPHVAHSHELHELGVGKLNNSVWNYNTQNSNRIINNISQGSCTSSHSSSSHVSNLLVLLLSMNELSWLFIFSSFRCMVYWIEVLWCEHMVRSPCLQFIYWWNCINIIQKNKFIDVFCFKNKIKNRIQENFWIQKILYNSFLIFQTI